MNNPPRVAAALSLDGLSSDARAGFDLAAAAGFRSIAFATNHPQLAPAELGQTARRHVRKILQAHDLSFASVRVAVPRSGLADAGTVDRTVDNTKQAIDLAHALGVSTVTLEIGNIPDAGSEASSLLAATRELAEHAGRAGVILALGSDRSERLRDLLAQLASQDVRANASPARAVAGGEDAVLAMARLAGLVGQMTVADAVRAGSSVRAVPLGEGQVAWPEVWRALRDQDFRGPIVVDVRDLPDGPSAARGAADTLRAWGI
jgi:sugar phosphate isomerase/epimerase